MFPLSNVISESKLIESAYCGVTGSKAKQFIVVFKVFQVIVVVKSISQKISFIGISVEISLWHSEENIQNSEKPKTRSITPSTVEGGELGRWCELGQNFSDSSPLLLLIKQGRR